MSFSIYLFSFRNLIIKTAHANALYSMMVKWSIEPVAWILSISYCYFKITKLCRITVLEK